MSSIPNFAGKARPPPPRAREYSSIASHFYILSFLYIVIMYYLHELVKIYKKRKFITLRFLIFKLSFLFQTRTESLLTHHREFLKLPVQAAVQLIIA